MPTSEDADPTTSMPLALQSVFYKARRALLLHAGCWLLAACWLHADCCCCSCPACPAAVCPPMPCRPTRVAAPPAPAPEQLQFTAGPVSTKDLTRSFGWDTADAFQQHDVQAREGRGMRHRGMRACCAAAGAAVAAGAGSEAARAAGRLAGTDSCWHLPSAPPAGAELPAVRQARGEDEGERRRRAASHALLSCFACCRCLLAARPRAAACRRRPCPAGRPAHAPLPYCTALYRRARGWRAW